MAKKHLTLEQVRAKIKKEEAQFFQLFTSPDGETVLAALVEEFYDCELQGPDPYDTAYKVGQRDVIRHILTRIESARTGD